MSIDVEQSPIITVGRYSGIAIDKLPNSYLRWMLTQDFPKAWTECAKKKLSQSSYNDLYLEVTRHAIDMFSRRFLSLWVQSEASKGEEALGIASFMANLAQEAWDKGEDKSKHRHQDDGVVRVYSGIKWVFGTNPNLPEFKDVITVMDSNE